MKSFTINQRTMVAAGNEDTLQHIVQSKMIINGFDLKKPFEVIDDAENHVRVYQQQDETDE